MTTMCSVQCILSSYLIRKSQAIVIATSLYGSHLKNEHKCILNEGCGHWTEMYEATPKQWKAEGDSKSCCWRQEWCSSMLWYQKKGVKCTINTLFRFF